MTPADSSRTADAVIAGRSSHARRGAVTGALIGTVLGAVGGTFYGIGCKDGPCNETRTRAGFMLISAGEGAVALGTRRHRRANAAVVAVVMAGAPYSAAADSEQPYVPRTSPAYGPQLLAVYFGSHTRLKRLVGNDVIGAWIERGAPIAEWLPPPDAPP